MLKIQSKIDFYIVFKSPKISKFSILSLLHDKNLAAFLFRVKISRPEL